MKKKYVLIQEKSTYNLNKSSSSDKYILEGIFAEFGKKNNNNRIYEEKEYLPHLDYLQKKVKQGNLIGELDHPENVGPSLSKASHIIEEINYDKDKRLVTGKIRLLSTDNGRNAKALIDDGVQLSISSRAVGSVREDKTVEIKKIITYDLVAEPGFGNAQLNRINEELGILNENVNIYELNEDEISMYISEDELSENKNEEKMSENNLDLTNKLLSEKIDKINEEYNDLARQNRQLIRDVSRLENRLQENVSGNVSEKVEEYLQYLSEETKKIYEQNQNFKKYNDYVANHVSKLEEYLQEFSTTTINEAQKPIQNIQKYLTEHTEYLKDKLGKYDILFEYVDQLSEQLQENKNNDEFYRTVQENFFDYLVEHFEQQNGYLDYVSEEFNTLENYTKYNAALLDKSIEFQDVIAEQQGNLKTNTEQTITEVKQEVKSTAKVRDIKERFNEILETAKKKKQEVVTEQSIQPYLGLLNESKRREFLLLERDQKEKIIQDVLKYKPITESQVLDLWERNTTIPNEGTYVDNLVKNIPSELYDKWNNLNEQQKTKIINESKMWNLDNAYRTKQFWYSRKMLNETNIDIKDYRYGVLNESVQNPLNEKEKINQSRSEFFNNIGRVLDRYNNNI